MSEAKITEYKLLERLGSGTYAIVYRAMKKTTKEILALLASLLQRDPARRITFEKFFDDPYLDLAHVACEENLEKAIALINRAIEMEQRQELGAAYRAYCQGLQYFVPITRAEPDPAKRQLLRQRVLTYLNRAEALKQHVYAASQREHRPPEVPPKVPPGEKERISRKVITGSSTDGGGRGVGETAEQTPSEPGIAELARDHESIARGLEIGRQAAKEASENKLDAALDSYTSALGLLIPVLHQDIAPGQKRLLRQRVVQWMEEAEQIKSIRSAQIMQEMESTEANHYACTVQ
uniref:non-specific serine/threonine protein kinase n=1 Tax=Anopheles epiroticus TaxID=199890 RepID=A0A182PFD4_9DIPT